MSEEAKVCPKCGGKMSIGSLVEGWGGFIYKPTRWAEGERKPEKLRLGRKKEFSVDSFRCSGCGFLEFYGLREIT